MLHEVERMGSFFKDGGNLFVFPEGHRNTGKDLGEFHSGVFKIARMYGCAVKVLSLSNTDKLFQPGKFFFNCMSHNRISIKTIGTVARAGSAKISAAALENRVREIFAHSGICSAEDV
jgi:1-acyl-sn-glycerol-3-phosphate acyltransferase